MILGNHFLHFDNLKVAGQQIIMLFADLFYFINL